MAAWIQRGFLLPLFTLATLCHGAPKPCLTPDQASPELLNHDLCISAHIYDVVELSSGTRFLDICPPGVPDDQCRLTFVSYRKDRPAVGDLRQFRDTNVEVRGILQSLQGRSAIVISHARQFRGGPPKFRANPRLARGFDAEQERPPIADPNLRSHGSARSFMNQKDRETLAR